MSELPGLNPDGELELVPHDPAFAADYLEAVARNLDRLARWEPWAQAPPTLDSIREYQSWAAERAALGEVIEFAIRLDGALVGATGARLGTGDERTEIGYWIDGALEGRGLAHRAASELIERLAALGRTRLRAQVGAENARSIRLLERLAFSRSAESVQALRLADRYVPMLRYVRG